MGRSSKDSRDIYYRKGKEEGYRARSAYKLLHLDEMYDFLGRPSGERALQLDDDNAAESSASAVRRMLVEAQASGKDAQDVPDDDGAALPKVIDLCAAPGSWSQVLLRTLPKGSRLVAVDLQPMAPLPGVVQVVGDITTQATARRVAHALVTGKDGGEDVDETSPIAASAKAHLIICDGAPDVTGLHALDEHMQAHLLLAALTIVTRLLLPGGTFIAKIFARRRPAEDDKPPAEHDLCAVDSAQLLVQQLRCLFAFVDVSKPRSSRAASVEHFIVARGFQGRGEGSDLTPFVEHGDLSGWES